MATKSTRSIPQQLNTAQVAITNTLADAEIQTLASWRMTQAGGI